MESNETALEARVTANESDLLAIHQTITADETGLANLGTRVTAVETQLGSVDVSAVGDSVTKGQVIATTSDSAYSELNTGSHLHFTLYDNDVKVDPMAYLNIQDK